MRLLGVDPGSRHTGIGIVDAEGARIIHVHHEVIHTGNGTLTQRLHILFRRLQTVIATYQPASAGMEDVFVAKNAASALKLGQARGALIAACADAGLEVSAYSPTTVKQAVVGFGRADKVQIQHMVQMLLNPSLKPAEDAADALAVAICHAHHSRMQTIADTPRTKRPVLRRWLSGTVRQLDPTGIIVLDTGGVGYEVLLSLQTLCGLQQNQQAELFIHTHVREDQITLFGFATPKERALFRRLTTVSGIGARLGLNLMSGMPVEELTRAIDHGDDGAIARTPGIGKKTAQRLILELRGKLDSDDLAGTAKPADANAEDVRSALINLGYKPAQIDPALKQAGAHADFESMFRAVLKALG